MEKGQRVLIIDGECKGEKGVIIEIGYGWWSGQYEVDLDQGVFKVFVSEYEVEKI